MSPSINPSDSRKHINLRDLNALKDTGASKKTSKNEASAGTGDQIVLSSMARDIQWVKSHIDAIAADRAQRLTELANAISRGEYPIDSQRVAEKLFSELSGQ